MSRETYAIGRWQRIAKDGPRGFANDDYSWRIEAKRAHSQMERAQKPSTAPAMARQLYMKRNAGRHWWAKTKLNPEERRHSNYLSGIHAAQARETEAHQARIRAGKLVPSAAPKMVHEMVSGRKDRAARAEAEGLKRATETVTHPPRGAVNLPEPKVNTPSPGPTKVARIGRGGKAALIGGAVGAPVAGAYLVRTNRKRRQED